MKSNNDIFKYRRILTRKCTSISPDPGHLEFSMCTVYPESLDNTIFLQSYPE